MSKKSKPSKLSINWNARLSAVKSGAALLPALLLILASCSDNHRSRRGTVDANNPSALMFANSFSQIYASTLSTACIACHQPGASASADYGVELDFSSQSSAYATLQGTVASATSRGQCGGVRIVAPGSPANSYLLAEVAQSYTSSNFGGVGGCTPAAVHYSALNLSQEQISAIADWIQAGAPNN